MARLVTSSRKSACALPELPRAHSALVEQNREACETLVDILAGKTGKIAPAYLAAHVLAVTRSADWPVRRAAAEALLRRLQFARRDGLRISERPPRGRAFGTYATRRPRSKARPYTTELRDLDPLAASCDCPDFVRNSLGACKHVLVVLDDLCARPRTLERVLTAAGRLETTPSRPRLSWDPLRPLTGRGDWLERVSLTLPGARPPTTSSTGSAALARAAGWFAGRNGNGRSKRFANGINDKEKRGRRSPQQRSRSGRGDAEVLLADQTLALARSYADDPERRLALIRDLLACAGAAGGRRSKAAGAAVDVDPALLALLRAELARLDPVVPGRERPGTRVQALRSLKQRLYPYQREGVERLLDSGSLLLADDMGLGKTAQAIAACHVLWKTRRIERGLLVVPAALKPQWLREWQRFTTAPATVVDATPEGRLETYRETRRGFLIVSYEQVLRDLDALLAWQPDVVVLDEAQRIKNWATKTAACIKAFSPPYRLVLTGTPMENRLDELASLFDWIDSMALEPKWRLVPTHSTYADGTHEIVGARNLDTLRERLAGHMLRRRRTEVLRQLPRRTDTVVPVELTEEQREAHDDLIPPIARLVSIARRRPLTQQEFLRLMSLLTTQRIIANGLGQLRFTEVWPQLARATRPTAAALASVASPKLGELRAIVSELVVEQQRKVVVFSSWRRMLMLAEWAVRDILSEHGLRAGFFTGHEKQRRRTQNIVEFHDDPAMRVLFASDAGGVGLNLQRAASACVNLELPWNPAVLEQRIGRIYRLGQAQPIDVYNLVSSGCIESRIATLVGDKRGLFRGVFDGDSDSVAFDRSGSFLDGVRRIVEPVEPGHAEPADVEDADTEYAEVDVEIDRLVTAADESADVAPTPVEAGASEPARAGVGLDAFAAEAGSEPGDGTATLGGPGGGDLPGPADVQRLLASVRIETTPDGGMRLEAPKREAATLAALFTGMARLMESAGR
jgi:superfamily II DNA or RNA helicase